MKRVLFKEPKAYMGWDIGGAHIKVARLLFNGDVDTVMQVACPLWKGTNRLEQAYRSICDKIPAADSTHVVTMTGEMTDNFDDREQGVHGILDAMYCLLNQDFKVYAGNEGIVDYRDVSDFQSVASKNWQASAEWLADRCGEGMLVDMGSTTTDIVPFQSGRIAAQGDDDTTRMQCEELIYTGVSRTPIMAIADHFIVNGVSFPIMAEYFATMSDVYRILDQLPENSDFYRSCDNADKTVAASAGRLERMFGIDWDGDLDATRAKAQAIAAVQQQKIRRALSKSSKRIRSSDSVGVIGAGVGYKIVQQIAEDLELCFVPYHRLFSNISEDLEDAVCCCATAVAVADLARKKDL